MTSNQPFNQNIYTKQEESIIANMVNDIIEDPEALKCSQFNKKYYKNSLLIQKISKNILYVSTFKYYFQASIIQLESSSKKQNNKYNQKLLSWYINKYKTINNQKTETQLNVQKMVQSNEKDKKKLERLQATLNNIKIKLKQKVQYNQKIYLKFFPYIYGILKILQTIFIGGKLYDELKNDKTNIYAISSVVISTVFIMGITIYYYISNNYQIQSKKNIIKQIQTLESQYQFQQNCEDQSLNNPLKIQQQTQKNLIKQNQQCNSSQFTQIKGLLDQPRQNNDFKLLQMNFKTYIQQKCKMQIDEDNQELRQIIYAKALSNDQHDSIIKIQNII